LSVVVYICALVRAAGVRLRVFAGLFAAVTAGALVLLFLPGSGYRLQRLQVFLHPGLDRYGAGYQHDQGLAAIANGGWFGVGLGQGRFKWGFLPAANNDFIFAVIGEELGVIGCVFTLLLFGLLAYAGLRIARRSTSPFRRLASAAVVALVVGQAIINIAYVVGLAPVTGLPLPLISDGGTALVATLGLLGMLASFARAEPAAIEALRARPPGPVGRLVWATPPPARIGDRGRRADGVGRLGTSGTDDREG
jgi:cell division protein FtsW